MGDVNVVQVALPDTAQLYQQGKQDLGNLRELRVGTGSSVFYTDKEGSRWGHIKFDQANAWIKIDGTAQFKTSDGDILLSTNAADGNFINVINTALNTSSKTILQDFTFQDTDYAGAFKSGNPTWDENTGLITGGSGVLINARGILGANDGTATFTLDATTGNATFAGELVAASGTLGTIASADIKASSSASGGNVHLYVGTYGGQCDVEYNGVQKGFFAASNTNTIIGATQNFIISSTADINEYASGNVFLTFGNAGGSGNVLEIYNDATMVAQFNDSNDLWVRDNVSAGSFTDRTPHYTGEAVKELRGIKGKKENGKDVIDHDTLPSFMRRDFKHADKKNKKGRVISQGETEPGRDIGGSISVLIKAIQELDSRLDAIESR